MPAPTDPRATWPERAAEATAAGADATYPGAAQFGSIPFGPPVAAGEVGTLGPYRIAKQLGAGGMGAVYLALDTRLNRQVALKVMLPALAVDPDAKGRFLREARAAARISHDNVVTVYEADERDGIPYIAMQFLRGESLDRCLKRNGTPEGLHVLQIGAETALGLAAAHRLGLVHRDIKPANLWLEAPNGRVVILDFGLARPVAAASELTDTGAVMGTPAFMSPEQARGQKVDHRTDLFSLGAVLYRLCAGENPFRGPTALAVLMALGAQEPTPVRELNPLVPPDFAELIQQLMAKNPNLRPQTADEVVRRCQTILARYTGTASIAPPPALAPTRTSAFDNLEKTETDSHAPLPRIAVPKPKPKPTVGRGLWVAVGLAAILVAIGIALAVRNAGRPEPKAAARPDEPKRSEEKPRSPTAAERAAAEREEAERIEAQAQGFFKQGEAYQHGRGVEIDFVQARKEYAKAADLGYGAAQNALAFMYESGLGGEQDFVKANELYRKARPWLEKAAAAGDAQAQNNLGYKYHYAWGGERNFAKAVEWYNKAVAQNHPVAQNNLGILYLHGQGVPQSVQKARELFEQSADQGNAFGQFNLGALYETGTGVERDLARALALYKRAAAQGHKEAKEGVERLKKK